MENNKKFDAAFDSCIASFLLLTKSFTRFSTENFWIMLSMARIYFNVGVEHHSALSDRLRHWVSTQQVVITFGYALRWINAILSFPVLFLLLDSSVWRQRMTAIPFNIKNFLGTGWWRSWR